MRERERSWECTPDLNMKLIYAPNILYIYGMKIIYAVILFMKQAAWLETSSCDFKLILKKVTGYGAQ